MAVQSKFTLTIKGQGEHDSPVMDRPRRGVYVWHIGNRGWGGGGGANGLSPTLANYTIHVRDGGARHRSITHVDRDGPHRPDRCLTCSSQHLARNQAQDQHCFDDIKHAIDVAGALWRFTSISWPFQASLLTASSRKDTGTDRGGGGETISTCIHEKRYQKRRRSDW